MRRAILPLLLATLLPLATGCSTVRVRVTGDSGVRYTSAWTTAKGATQTRSGTVPATLTFKEDFTGWFQNTTGSGSMRVRIYEGMGKLVDQTIVNRPGRVVVERKNHGIAFRVE